ncbi:MAG: hypothetical protein M1816_003317 [Peltula sp. TS41687]|nr:MAG: hypothetical protein M1816_003317 [Peltula sp. TS41687]
MAQDLVQSGGVPSNMIERTTLCLPNFDTGVVVHKGDDGFQDEARRHFDMAQNNVAEQLMILKSKLKEASKEDFWKLMMIGMTDLMGSQFAFVTKRILVDDQTSAVEMPPIGEPGSCLVAEAYYYNDGQGTSGMHRDLTFLSYGAPCGYMRHDKVFLIPERYNQFITNNPNDIPIPPDAYIAVPLFSEGKCFAHFGILYTPEGLKRRVLSWGFIEMLLHALEDLVQQRLLSGQSFSTQSAESTSRRTNKVIPHEAILASQSLKPYARSLSHELRTPMQGVVGMLDVMHATVLESAACQKNQHVRKIFEDLRENIEVVQDSSRRAVEAADNVVQAYDMNMTMPGTPESRKEDNEGVDEESSGRRGRFLDPDGEFKRRPSSNKRPRSSSTDRTTRHLRKYRAIEFSPEAPLLQLNQANRDQIHGLDTASDEVAESIRLQSPDELTPHLPAGRPKSPNPKRTRLKRMLRTVIRESLQVGGRPDSTLSVSTENGEDIEARSADPKGDAKVKMIRWTVDPAVPDPLPIDERDLAKLVSCVFLNALKFTEDGEITLTARLGKTTPPYLHINVIDTGPGIPSAFLPYLFQPFSREDGSRTRRQDGLGLGLMVAKGIARKIGGDVFCARSLMYGPRRGTEFEIRIPIASILEPDGSTIRTPTATPRHSPAPSSLRPGSEQVVYDTIRVPDCDSLGEETRSRNDLPIPNPLGLSTSTLINIEPPPQSPESPTPSKPQPALKPPSISLKKHSSSTKSPKTPNNTLAIRHPLTFLVAEDNKINRRLLVNMLLRLGYTKAQIHEAYDGQEAVRQMELPHDPPIDIILMDLWMPRMDGFEAASKILSMCKEGSSDDTRNKEVTIVAVTADATTEALQTAADVGMKGLMTKPYKLADLEGVIVRLCTGGDDSSDDDNTAAANTASPSTATRSCEEGIVGGKSSTI